MSIADPDLDASIIAEAGRRYLEAAPDATAQMAFNHAYRSAWDHQQAKLENLNQRWEETVEHIHEEVSFLREHVNDMGGDKDFLGHLAEYDPGHRLDRHRREELSEFFNFGVAYMQAKLDAQAQELAGLRECHKELVDAIMSINHGKAHEVMVGLDDRPCYWQRGEWVDWMLGLAKTHKSHSH